MSEDPDHDLTADLPGADEERLEELADRAPLDPETAKDAVNGPDIPAGTLSLAGGGLLLLSALRSAGRGQLRAIPKGIAAAGLLGYGLGKRDSDGDVGLQSSTGLGLRADDEDDSSTFEPTSVEDVESGSNGKETSDAAAAAANRPDLSQQSEMDPETGEIEESPIIDADEDGGSEIEFTEDADGSKGDLEAEDDDPRRDTADDDEPLEIDVSDSAMADEPSEAAGPTAEQAQPTQTDSTEPEETPDEDASDMKVEPDDEESADRTGEETDEGEGDSGEDDEPEA
ncbi:hypothetical protein [Halopiger xanaduensis]|uniref:Uncharacterized protein n=1 Tax=Halopiger xanaduensis (strain DSM 18323 / JCM 14033 / SH-6) TaxID=797210 RepID=F8DB52_HALXS|nr:hypothetical protein [Halopiger xanaduensis]AEH38463.1 hypothetical protein Halxa_3858 [Halopiger xanaduensis SH-6]